MAMTPTLVLAPGAGAGQNHPWMLAVSQGLESRGIHVVTFDFPYRAAGKSVPDKPAVLEKTWSDTWGEVAAKARGPMFAGGTSMGGRIASQVAALQDGFHPMPSGLVFFGYPLHPPGKPTQRRDTHLPSVNVPMMFFQGSRDPFASPDEMRGLTTSLGDHATLEIVEGGDHSLTVRTKQKDAVFARVLDQTAEWIKKAAGHRP